MLNWLEGKEASLVKIELDHSRKWNIGRKVYSLTKLSAEEKKAIFDNISKGDESDKKIE